MYDMFLLLFRLCRLWNCRKKNEQAWADLPEEVRLTCTQFIKYHKDQCQQDIVKKKRLKLYLRSHMHQDTMLY